ncbi:MAG: RNA methyltransferase [Flavobacteriaceae bacterium]|nr:RNA methyltransferase [Flavobacteriaceae bacterium]|tara:strand:- start:3739 stop:4968 length:1230 start_codon:yes stop_codon:yes gene_type:complete
MITGQVKWHNNLLFAVITGLNEIFFKKKYAKSVCKKIIDKNKKWGARDRDLFYNTIYECVRWYRKYIHCAGIKELESPEQLWLLLGTHIIMKKQLLPEIDKFSIINKRSIKKRESEIKNNRRINESIPDWLDEIGVKNFGEDIWNKEVKAFNQKSHLVIRCNNLKTDIRKLKIIFNTENIQYKIINSNPNALIINHNKKITNLKSYKAGYFEIQDLNSQEVGLSCSVRPGMTIIDACAGAGGKTMHLAELMKNKGYILALDPNKKKLIELRKRAKRNGVDIIKTYNTNKTESILKFKGKVDRVLIDAPCSGLGVIKRNPDTKLKMNPKILKKILNIQENLINYWSKFVKNNGEIIYSTCSILESENNNQIRNFLKKKNGKNFVIKNSKTYLSHLTGFDGFYIAQLKKCE